MTDLNAGTYNLHNDGAYNLHNDTIVVVIDAPTKAVTITSVANTASNWTTTIQHVPSRAKLPIPPN